MTFNFYTLNTIRWNDQDRRRMIDMVTIIVEQHRSKKEGATWAKQHDVTKGS